MYFILELKTFELINYNFYIS